MINIFCVVENRLKIWRNRYALCTHGLVRIALINTDDDDDDADDDNLFALKSLLVGKGMPAYTCAIYLLWINSANVSEPTAYASNNPMYCPLYLYSVSSTARFYLTAQRWIWKNNASPPFFAIGLHIGPCLVSRWVYAIISTVDVNEHQRHQLRSHSCIPKRA